MPRIILSLFLFSILNSCYDERAEIKHGLSSIPLTGFTYRGVVDRSIKLNFLVDKGEATKITARLETQYDYDASLNYEWKLGEGVSVINGDLKGQVAHMRKGAPIEIELVVKGFTPEKASFVRFEILGTNPQKRVFVDGVLNSQEKSFEKIVQEIEEYKKSNQ